MDKYLRQQVFSVKSTRLKARKFGCIGSAPCRVTCGESNEVKLDILASLLLQMRSSSTSWRVFWILRRGAAKNFVREGPVTDVVRFQTLAICTKVILMSLVNSWSITTGYDVSYLLPVGIDNL